MPTTSKQKAREKRSRQSDTMSDMKNLDVLLGTYSRNGVSSQLSENEENLDRRA